MGRVFSPTILGIMTEKSTLLLITTVDLGLELLRPKNSLIAVHF
jgi:hypothetical protein